MRIMSVTITVSKTLETFWASDEELRTLTDEQIVNLVQEDLHAFIDGSTWDIWRTETKGGGAK